LAFGVPLAAAAGSLKARQRVPEGLKRTRRGGDEASACASAEADWTPIPVDPRRSGAKMQRGRNKSLNPQARSGGEIVQQPHPVALR